MGYNTSYRLECIDTAIVAAWIESGERGSRLRPHR